MASRQHEMDLLLGTLVLRPYVFLFLVAFVVAGCADLGWRRTGLFVACLWPLAWLAEYSSTRTGIPFGLYHYTMDTRDQELFLAGVPFFDSLSFTFLAYASLCLVRRALPAGRASSWPASRPVVAILSGFLMTMLDVVIDPLAVRGDRWFLGRIFYYAEEGVYFGVPLSNFAGWFLVGTFGVGVYLWLHGKQGSGRLWPGVTLYYAVLLFNLSITAWIGEWGLVAVGLTLHLLLALALATPRYRARVGVV